LKKEVVYLQNYVFLPIYLKKTNKKVTKKQKRENTGYFVQ